MIHERYVKAPGFSKLRGRFFTAGDYINFLLRSIKS